MRSNECLNCGVSFGCCVVPTGWVDLQATPRVDPKFGRVSCWFCRDCTSKVGLKRALALAYERYAQAYDLFEKRV